MPQREHPSFEARAEGGTITFEVVKETYGWAIRRDRQMMSPVWCKALAVDQAQRMVDALRRHGERAEMKVSDIDDEAGGPAQAPAPEPGHPGGPG